MKKIKRFLVNPYEDFSTAFLVRLGVFLYVISSIFVYLQKMQFNGFMHLYPKAEVSVFQVFGVHALMIGISVLLLWLTALVFQSKTRFVDVLVTILIARWPFYVLLVSNELFGVNEFEQQVRKALADGDMMLHTIAPVNMLAMSVFGILALCCIVYHYYLVVTGMRVASNNKKTAVGLLFVALYFIVDILVQLFF